MKKSQKDQLKELYEWRHKCTLSDTLIYKRSFYVSKALYIILMTEIVLIALMITLFIINGPILTLIVTMVLFFGLMIVGIYEFIGALNTYLFICKDGLGLKKKKSFKTMPYKLILSASILEDRFKLATQDSELIIPFKGYDHQAIDGLKTILRAEGFGGEPYPYALFFNEQAIILEGKEDPYSVQVFDKFKETFRYFHAGLEYLEIDGKQLTRFQQLSDHSAVFHLKALRVLKSHPLNAPMQDQKTDHAVLIFTKFQLETLSHNGRNLKSPYKTLRKLLHRSKIIKGEFNNQHIVLSFLSDKLLYKISFTYEKVYAAWNAFEKDAWYQIN